jgi:hypothetical protein
MDFNQVQEFFKSWGLYPTQGDPSADDLNPEVIDQGINRRVYERLCEEAERLHGESFRHFCARQIDATDDSFYLVAETWEELEEAWIGYSAHK